MRTIFGSPERLSESEDTNAWEILTQITTINTERTVRQFVVMAYALMVAVEMRIAQVQKSHAQCGHVSFLPDLGLY